MTAREYTGINKQRVAHLTAQVRVFWRCYCGWDGVGVGEDGGVGDDGGEYVGGGRGGGGARRGAGHR